MQSLFPHPESNAFHGWIAASSKPEASRVGRMLQCLVVLWVGSFLPIGAQEFLSVTVEDRFFNSPESHPVIRVEVRPAMQLDLLVYEAGGRPLMFREGKTAATAHELVLRDLPASDRGLYLFHLFGRSPEGRRLAEYPDKVEGGTYIDVADCRWVSETGRVEYFLPKAACLRIRAGLVDSAYVDEVLPWEAQPAGRKSIPWVGATENPVVREMMGRPDFQIRVLALTLPVNLVADQRLRAGRFAGNTTPSAELPAAYADRMTMPGGSLYSTVRKRSQISIADDYSLTLGSQPAAGRGVVNLRLDCSEADRGRLLNQRFEVMVFIDGVFLMEDETALLPFNYRLATRGLAPGRHLVTMNVLDSQGVPGTASHFIEVAADPSVSPGQK